MGYLSGMTKPIKIGAAGMVWYKREDYPLILEIMDDNESLATTYDDFITGAEKVFNQLTAQGMRMIRAEIDPRTFPEWCSTHGFKKLNSEARSAFANRFAYETLTKENPDLFKKGS